LQLALPYNTRNIKLCYVSYTEHGQCWTKALYEHEKTHSALSEGIDILAMSKIISWGILVKTA